MLEDRMNRLAERLLAVRMGQMMVNERNKAGAFRVPVHLALGHEAIAVAVHAAMEDGDKLLLTHRNIHYNLARNPLIAEKIAEFRLEASGRWGGALACMNFSDPDAGIPYTSSILANSLGVAPGVALAQRILGTRAVTFAVTGDGAIEEGAFYECLLMARSVSGALVVVVENNGWSLATEIHERRAAIDLAAIARALDIPYVALEGNAVAAYAERMAECRHRAAEGSRPVLVEVAVTTLGDWRQQQDGFPDGKSINYHAGIAPTVDIEAGPVIARSAADPVFVLLAAFGADALAALADDAVASLGTLPS